MASLKLRRGENEILASLSDREFDAAIPDLEIVRLELRETVYAPGARIEFVYFPLSSMLSLVTVMRNGSQVEAATIGNEGMTGSPLSLPGTVSPLLMICQIPGEAIRMPARAFRSWLAQSGGVQDIMDRHAQALVALIAQTAACNRLHAVEQRCARWLLMTHDRARSDEFPLTQEFLSAMLGVRRASVSTSAIAIQRRGYIRYHRGMIEIIDRRGLEALSCECYEVTRQHQRRAMKRD